MCEDSVVVIRDVTNIALIGSETTTTRSVRVSDGEVVDVVEPSTVIDCHGFPTGFAFFGISQLSIKRISLTQCGGYFTPTVVSQERYLSSLIIVSTHNLQLYKVYFKNTRDDYSLVTINVLGQSIIVDVVVIQVVPFRSQYQQGRILLLYTNDLLTLSPNKDILFSVESMVFLYTTSWLDFTHSWPYLRIDICSCHAYIHMTIENISVHTMLDSALKSFIYSLHALFEIGVCKVTSAYEIAMQNLRFTCSQQLMIQSSALQLSYTKSQKNCSVSSVTSIINITHLAVSKYRGVSVKLCDKESNMNSHKLLFYRCTLTNSIIHGGQCNVHIVFRNTTFRNKHNHEMDNSLLFVQGLRYLLIENSNFLHNWGSGLNLVDTVVYFRGVCTFYNNTAMYGGGLLIEDPRSVLYILPNTLLNFTNNLAFITGGAMHVREPFLDNCFIQLSVGNLSVKDGIKSIAEHQNIHLFFWNNTAGIAGTTIWGGSLDSKCYLGEDNQVYIDLVPLLGVANSNSYLSAISSSPEHLCYCNGTLNCTSTTLQELGPSPSTVRATWYGPSYMLHPGQTFNMNIAIAGQQNGLVPGIVQVDLKQMPTISIGNLQETQRVNEAKCTNLEYTLYSSFADIEIDFHIFVAKTAEHVSEHLNYYEYTDDRKSLVSVSISVTLKSCPVGFQHNLSIGSCICLPPLLHYMDNTSCDINTQTVQRTPTLWINASFIENNTQILAVHQHCPFDYCDPNKQRVDLSYPDQQCAHNRSGILCGGCRRGLSLTLGSPKCKQCFNRYLSLLVIFPAAGVVLVAVLTILNLTVSAGTINGLILYVNIIRALHPIFFPSTTFLSVFVAWMNLDIGMNSCLYDGMDFYGLTWLQFVFPVYIWLLVSIMIITSRYSTTAAKLVSRDAVKVLATLFLLSYAKLLRTIITVLSFTYISYEDSDRRTYSTAVWLYDGNIRFAAGKHIPLLLVALGFGVCYIIPFTLLLVLAPFLQARSHRYRALRWVNKLIPFLDAYQGPYSIRFRFWSGLLLIMRVFLFVGFALNSLGDEQINLKFVITFLVSLLSLQLLLSSSCHFGSLYNVPLTNAFEIFFLLNLVVLSTWSLLQMNSTSSSLMTQTVITDVCVGLAFIVFVFILAQHVYIRLKGMGIVTKLWLQLKANTSPLAENPVQEAVERQTEVVQKTTIPTTFIELREPLLTDH